MSAEPRGFDPTRHLMKVSGKDYLPVAARIAWFRAEHPDGSIVTEMVQHQNQEAVFRSSVSWPTETGIVVCTDYGSEASDDFADYLEKASTKATGRALGLAGYGTMFSDDHHFGADEGRVVDSPRDSRSASRQSGGKQASATQEATPRQIGYLHTVAREVGLSGEDLEERAQRTFGHGIVDLSRRDISTMIEQIQAGRPIAPQADAKASAVAAQAPMPTQSSNGSAGPITPGQKSVINQLLDPENAARVSQSMFGVPVTRLTTEQAHELIDIERRAEAARN